MKVTTVIKSDENSWIKNEEDLGVILPEWDV